MDGGDRMAGKVYRTKWLWGRVKPKTQPGRAVLAP